MPPSHFTTGTTRPCVVVKPAVLSPASEYKVALHVSAPDGRAGSATAVVVTLAAPTGGMHTLFGVYPAVGVQNSTFTLKARGWGLPGCTTMYRFMYDSPEGNAVALSELSLSSEIKTRLPLGQLTLKVYCRPPPPHLRSSHVASTHLSSAHLTWLPSTSPACKRTSDACGRYWCRTPTCTGRRAQRSAAAV